MAWPTEAGAIASGTHAGAATAAVFNAATAGRSGWLHTLTYTVERHGNIIRVQADSNLGDDDDTYYHWYIDGTFVAVTQDNEYWFNLEDDEQVRIDVLDTHDPDFDSMTNAPAGYPARRTIYWYRSMEDDIDYYKVEQKKDSDAWAVIGLVEHDDSLWDYSLLSPRLTDLASYQWRVTPVDQAGNDGTATTITAETVVRRPDAPDFAMTYDAGTDKITFASV